MPPFECPPLPYAYDALASKGISAETLKFHHDKHHVGYVTKLNALIADKPDLQSKSLEDLIMTQKGGIFNCAAQTWNHTFYWSCMAANGGGAPSGQVGDRINAKWGSFDKFKEEFSGVAAGHFGSGWAWLVINKGGELEIVATHDAGCPLTDGQKPVITCDVWEHAYYIDYRNDRAAYIKAWWDTVNWDFANKNLQ
jgi:Fe-Mn family superoxide dismutase